MKRMMMAALLAAAMVPGAAMAEEAPAVPADDAPVVIEAKTFMAGYADDLLTGDRAAIANRYDRRGAWRVGGGEKTFDEWNAIRRYYAEGWNKPATFEWRDFRVRTH